MLEIINGKLKCNKRKEHLKVFKCSFHCETRSASDIKLNFVDSESDISDHESDYERDEGILSSDNGYMLWEWGQLQTLISANCVCSFCRQEVELTDH